MKAQTLTGKWGLRQVGAKGFLPASVPGCVHVHLLASDRIPDPFVADNEKRVQWVAETDWEYCRSFEADADVLVEERVFLVCDGLDTLAEITLNGHLLGATDNMFRQYRWDVKPLLQDGENKLSIVFRSPVAYVTSRQAERPLHGVQAGIPGAPHLRKAPSQFGWDWGPRLPSSGVWKDIRLEGRSISRLDDVHLRQHHENGQVTIAATIVVERWHDVPLEARIRATDPDGTLIEAEIDLSNGAQTLHVLIPQPKLWWPNGYGDQPLYAVDITLLAAEQVVDHRAYQMGLRTLELRRAADEWGESFTFVVNGVPVFAKGADWIPSDSFATRTSDEQLEYLLGSAVAAHQNMIRVWGGGFYEEERFYDLCDRYGILVWQDFVFACSAYPLDDGAFVQNVRIEAVENIRRLRHRACLALWCGNNEMEWLGTMESRGSEDPRRDGLQRAYVQFYHHVLPELCSAEDPDHSYWPSSPSSGTPFEDPNSQERGNMHYWEVWHGRKPFTEYRDQYPRFMSEFGFQSLPPLKTIRTYADEADWNMTSYIMEHHQRSPKGNGLMVAQMTDTFRLPKDFDSLTYLSMVLQAEGIRYGVEHWRRNMHRVSGTLYWQLNDCWPVASWSSLDYFGRWKALHYAARRFYAPVLLSIEDDPPRMGVHVTSDLTETWSGTISWTLETMSGEAWVSGQEDVVARPLASTKVIDLDFTDHISDENCRDVVFVCELRQGSARVSSSIASFAPTKHLSLTDPGLAVQVRADENRVSFDVTATSLARFVELSLEGVDTVFSDNYFDVPAGRVLSVSCPLPRGWATGQARRALRARSLYDSFA